MKVTKNEFIKNPDIFNDWMERYSFSNEEKQILLENSKFIKKFNGDINVFDDVKLNQGLHEDFETEKSKLFKFLKNNNIESSNYDLFFKKRATEHIQELIKCFVDDDTLVICPSFGHVSIENSLKIVKNIFVFDEEDENRILQCRFSKLQEKLKDFKKVFCYFVGTDFTTGRKHNNEEFLHIIELVNDKLVASVLDCVQEMFLYQRDYSHFDFIIGTAHCMIPDFDMGLLFAKKSKNSEAFKKFSTAYQRVDTIKRLNQDLSIVANEKHLSGLKEFKQISLKCFDLSYLAEFKLHTSADNFLSFYSQNEKWLSAIAKKYISIKFIEPAKKEDPGINVEYNKRVFPYELIIRIRAQPILYYDVNFNLKMQNFINAFNNIKTFLSETEQ